MVIASQFEGRVRIRDESLKKEPFLSAAREALMDLTGVTDVEANPRVGSLLVLYSAASTRLERIVGAVEELISSRGSDTAETSEAAKPAAAKRLSLSLSPRLKRRIKNNVVNLGMLASLLLSLVAGVLDLKKLHILAGIIFVAFFGEHLYTRRRLVFTW